MRRVDPEQFEFATARLRLRRPEPRDASAVFAIQGDPRTNQFGSTPDASLEESRARIDEWRDHWDAHGFGYWAVEPREGGEVIALGGLCFREIEGETVLNLYYRLSPAVWGKGIATEIAGEALRLARAWLPGLKLVAIINPANAPSARVAQRVGMRREKQVFYKGMMRDLYVAPVPTIAG